MDRKQPGQNVECDKTEPVEPHGTSWNHSKIYRIPKISISKVRFFFFFFLCVSVLCPPRWPGPCQADTNATTPWKSEPWSSSTAQTQRSSLFLNPQCPQLLGWRKQLTWWDFMRFHEISVFSLVWPCPAQLILELFQKGLQKVYDLVILLQNQRTQETNPSI